MRAFRFSAATCDATLVVVSSMYVSFAYAVAEYHLPYVPVCPFLLITGTPCPLCGSTRTIGALLHGDVSLGLKTLPTLVSFAFILAVGAISLVRLASLFWQKSRHRVAMSNNRLQRTALRAAAEPES
jgi:hypothetical protein